MKENKIIIGSTQFGLSYGISNTKGKTKENSINKILKLSRKKKVRNLYTSNYYGIANQVLGKKNLKAFNIILKFKKNDFLKKNIINEIKKTSKILRKNINTIIIDNFESIPKLRAKKIYKNLISLKSKKIINKFGYSIYSFKNLKKVCNKYRPDIIQCPYNIIDRRIEKNNHLNFFKQKKIEVHIRSIFLQGLLLMDLKKIPKKFMPWKNLLVTWQNWIKKENITAVEACYSFVSKSKFISKILIGVNNFSQFEEIINSKIKKNLRFPDVSSQSNNLINPINW